MASEPQPLASWSRNGDTDFHSRQPRGPPCSAGPGAAGAWPTVAAVEVPSRARGGAAVAGAPGRPLRLRARRVATGARPAPSAARARCLAAMRSAGWRTDRRVLCPRGGLLPVCPLQASVPTSRRVLCRPPCALSCCSDRCVRPPGTHVQVPPAAQGQAQRGERDPLLRAVRWRAWATITRACDPGPLWPDRQLPAPRRGPASQRPDSG